MGELNVRRLAPLDMDGLHGTTLHHTAVQFWLAVPLLFVILALMQLRHRPRTAA